MACKYAENYNPDMCRVCGASCNSSIPVEDGTEDILSQKEYEELVEKFGLDKKDKTE